MCVVVAIKDVVCGIRWFSRLSRGLRIASVVAETDHVRGGRGSIKVVDQHITVEAGVFVSFYDRKAVLKIDQIKESESAFNPNYSE